MMWSLLASKHDKDIVAREAREDTIPHITNKPLDGQEGQGDTDIIAQKTRSGREESISAPDRRKLFPVPVEERSHSRSRSRSRIVSDAGQVSEYGVDQSQQHSTSASTPIVLIPGVDTNTDTQSTVKTPDNVSTMAVLNADGVLTTTDASTVKSDDSIILRPSSLSDQNGGVAPTPSDSAPHTPSITTDSATELGVDGSNASTMAVRHVPYILKEHEEEKQKRPSKVDEVSPHAERDAVVSNGAETPKANGQDRDTFPFHVEKERPEMPDRNEFVTAEEIQA